MITVEVVILYIAHPKQTETSESDTSRSSSTSINLLSSHELAATEKETCSAAVSTVALPNTLLQGSFKGYCLSISPEKEVVCLNQNHLSPALSIYPFTPSL